ncbi:hypothetical protein KCV01_g13685, partial [Aureobasidium melanogenum]
MPPPSSSHRRRASANMPQQDDDDSLLGPNSRDSLKPLAAPFMPLPATLSALLPATLITTKPPWAISTASYAGP